jgi:hypothetical protein
MKLYLSVDQAKLVRQGLYNQERELKATIEKGVTGPIKDVAEDGLQQIRMLTTLLNEQIEQEST